MTIPFAILLFLAAILGGTLNAVAGGGTFITLPSLIFAGVLPINANATSTVALWPGTVASIGAYRRELVKQDRRVLLVLGGTSLIGGILGAELLIDTSQSTFLILLPYLLLLATVLFAVSGPITSWMRERRAAKQESTAATPGKVSWLRLVVIAVFQLVIAVYGGYFGGGIGILMLATLGLMGMENIHEMNSVKTLLTAFINGVALVIFIVRGIVNWPQAVVMIVGAIIGGYGAAYFARKIDPRVVRVFVILVGLSMTIYFFIYPK